MTAPTLNLAPQRPAFHARQIARLVAVAFERMGWLDKGLQDQALAGEHLPAMLISTPDGREFLITVEEV